jgi:hypothetical protein
VKVDFPSSSVSHDEASRETGPTTAVVVEAVAFEALPRGFEIVAVEREIEIGVPPRLVADERVDPPAPVHPCADADGLEPVQYLYDVGTGHVPAVASGGQCSHSGPREDGARPAWWASAVSLSALAVAAAVASLSARRGEHDQLETWRRVSDAILELVR